MKTFNGLEFEIEDCKELYEFWIKNYPDLFKKIKQQKRLSKLKRIFEDEM